MLRPVSPIKQKILGNTRFPRICVGGDKRDRTADLLNAIQALSQLSYTPIFALCGDSLDIIAREAVFVKRCREIISFSDQKA